MTQLMTPQRYEQCQSHGSLRKNTFCLPLLSPPSLAILNWLDYNFLVKGKTWLIYANVPLLKHNYSIHY